MGDLRKNISKSEIACNCGCGQAIVNDTILDYFQLVCDECANLAQIDKVNAIITSCNRCEKWNHLEGGKPTSKHLKGQAIDFMVTGFTEHQLIVIAGLVLPVGKFYAYSPAKGVMHLQIV